MSKATVGHNVCGRQGGEQRTVGHFHQAAHIHCLLDSDDAASDIQTRQRRGATDYAFQRHCTSACIQSQRFSIRREAVNGTGDKDVTIRQAAVDQNTWGQRQRHRPIQTDATVFGNVVRAIQVDLRSSYRDIVRRDVGRIYQCCRHNLKVRKRSGAADIRNHSDIAAARSQGKALAVVGITIDRICENNSAGARTGIDGRIIR